MPSQLPDGEPVPEDGRLPDAALETLGAQPFSLYVHVPFCVVRCGYCDFNTYTAEELGGGASRATYAETAIDEIRLARRVLGDKELPIDTVFFGGGTPTLLPPDDLGRILQAARDEFGLQPDAEVTTEANPDSVTPQSLARIRELGFNRISYGVQSVVPHVLRTLDRTHDPERIPGVVAAAHEAGLAINLDLIYGTPGESADDWQRSLDAVVDLQPDHVSAYALIVEEGTQLARRIKRGELPMPDDDELADRYLAADEMLAKAGYGWYEVSNWATSTVQRCRHNLAYWYGHDWWGVGPGAHSHVGGTRWWNVKHPKAYAERLAAAKSPGAGREILDQDTRREERILLEIRLADGLPTDVLDDAGREAAEHAAQDGLLDRVAFHAGRAVLTTRGRLLADAVVRDLTV